MSWAAGNRLRAGLVVYALDAPTTGIPRYAIELVDALRGLPDGPEIVILHAGGLGALAGRAGESHLVAGRLRSLLLSGSWRVNRLVRALKLDLVHDTTGLLPFLFGTDGASCVATLHDAQPLSHPSTSRRLERLLFRHWLPRMVPRVDALITVSAYAADEIRRLLPSPRGPLYTIPYGVSRRFSSLSVADARQKVRERFGLTSRYVLFVGALTPRKNVERLVQAFCLLSSRVSDVGLVLAGPEGWAGPDVSAARRALGPRLLLTGPLDDRDLVPLYRAASVVTLPSLSESFGMPIVEAMMAGVPVVASTATSMPEVAGDAAILIEPTDVLALANALLSVLNDPSVASDLVIRGRRRAAAFDWSEVAQRTADVYRTAVARRLGSEARV